MQQTERRIDTEMKEVKNRILAMAGFVEQALEVAIRSILDRSSNKLSEVHACEIKINQAHIDVDNHCLEILARQSPVAADLRMILAIVKINTDLERMGDQAVNLAKNATHYLQHEPVAVAHDLPRMTSLVREMVRDSLDAFVNKDAHAAQKVLESDDAVDAFKRKMVATLTETMKTEPSKIEAALNLILITRNLERTADHATNIAEDVIFISTGEDVRHGSGRAKAGEKK